MTSHLPLPTPLKILVLGGGALGALYSYILSSSTISRITPTIVCRSNYAQVTAHGYRLTTSRWGNSIYRPRTISSPSQLGKDEIFDYVLVTTKVPNDNKALPILEYKAHVNSNTVIVLLQNGVGIEEVYKCAFPENIVVSGVVYILASQPSPGEVDQVGQMERLFLGIYSPGIFTPELAGEKVQALTSHFQSGGSNTKLRSDIQRERWRKLTWNGCFNTLCAITNSDTATLLSSSKEMVELVTGVIEEICDVAKSLGVDLGDKRKMSEFQVERTKGLKRCEPSMLMDLRAGREMEVEAICGNAWRVGEEKGVEVGRLKSIYAMLVAMNCRLRNERNK
ncbi:hypothetical protein RUND412_005908 [Rhizina undulata]